MANSLFIRDAEPVSWIGGPRGNNEDSEMIRMAIVTRGVATYGPLVRDLAEQLFLRDRSRIGAGADIGFFGSFYLPYARRVVERAEGTEIVIGNKRLIRTASGEWVER